MWKSPDALNGAYPAYVSSQGTGLDPISPAHRVALLGNPDYRALLCKDALNNNYLFHPARLGCAKNEYASLCAPCRTGASMPQQGSYYRARPDVKRGIASCFDMSTNNRNLGYLYDPSDYDEDGQMRIGLLLWLVIVYLSRHIVLLMLVAVSSIVGLGKGLEFLYSSPLFLLAALPALLVLVAGLRRGPKAGPWLQRVWSAGRWLLLVSVIIDLALLMAGLLWGHLEVNEYRALWGLCDLYALAYLVRSRRLRVLFSTSGVEALVTVTRTGSRN